MIVNEMISHATIIASVDLASAHAEKVNYQAVTAEFAATHFSDRALWLWSESAAEMGLDPWTSVTAIDTMPHPSADRVYIIETRTGERIVPAEYRLFTPRVPSP